jgi:hypothetical protein
VVGDGGSVFLGDTATSGQGVYNEAGGTINNVGVKVDGTSAWGEIGDMTGYLTPPYGIYNRGAINDYCGETLTYSSYDGNSPNTISCHTVQFYVESPDATLDQAYITLSWGPFVLPWTQPASEGYGYTVVFTYPATGSLTYSFPSHVYELDWQTMKSLLYTCQSGCSGTVTISSDASFVVTYRSPHLAAPTISSPQFIDNGQSATLSTTSSFSGGTPPYTCQWLVMDLRVENSFVYFGGSFPCSPGDKPGEPTGALAAVGAPEFELQVTDSSSPAQVVTSNAVTVTVFPALVAPTVSASTSEIDLGQSVGLTMTPVSTEAPLGIPPYTYQWYWEAPGQATYSSISGATQWTYNFSTTGSTPIGTWSFELSLTDRSGTPETVTSSPVQVTVYSNPTGVPQFPLGLALVFALVVPALLVLRKRAPALRGLAR